MELRQIKELMAAMARTGTKQLRIKEKDFELELERERHVEKGEAPAEASELEQQLPYVPGRPSQLKAIDIPPSFHPPRERAGDGREESEGVYIRSPMVGTFYSAPGAEEPELVKVGEKIGKDTVVCIIEAMKVMNEVKAGVEGTVEEILVENSHPVEFGTKLFKISY
ncbi:MAG: acetyl-CoA carboxylase biotin carboxyl carrier protein [Waddliaceae bacterium]